MSLLLGLAAIGAMLYAAVTGRAYRGLYAGAALLLLSAGGCVVAISGPDTLTNATGDAAQRRGAEVLVDYGTDVGITLVLAGFGALVGAVIYRARA